MKDGTNPDAFLSLVYQLRNELSDLDEVVSGERLTVIILDALPVEKYSIIVIRAIKYPSNSKFEEIKSLTKTVFINHSERLEM